MINWLERARREIPRGTDRVTANADERSLAAVTAVPQQAGSGISCFTIGSNGSAPDPVLPDIEEASIRAWLDHIDETDPDIIAEVLDKCRTDDGARTYFLHMAEDVPNTLTCDDDRR